jgi:hypothetical protein
MEGIVAGGPGLVAWGGSFEGNRIWTSTDGITWEPAETDQIPPGTLINDIVTLGTRLVAVGTAWTDIFDDSGEWVNFTEDLAILTSEDGIAWSLVGDTRGEFAGASAERIAAWSRGITITGSFCDESWNCTSEVWNSPNGLTWTRSPLNLDADNSWMNPVVAGGPGLIGAGGADDPLEDRTTTLFWTSADGVTWQVHDSDPVVFAEGAGINDFAWFADQLVGVGASPVDRAPAVWIWTP